MMMSCELAPFNYLDLCRLCLDKDRVSVPIFENEDLIHKIITCRLPVKVSREDKLPKKICDECVKKVESTYQFWNTTLNTENQLLQFVGEGDVANKVVYQIQAFNTNVMEQAHNNSTFDHTEIQDSEHENIIADMLNSIPLLSIATASDEQFNPIPLDSNITLSGLIQEVQESLDNEPITSGLQQQNLSDVSGMTMEQTVYNEAKNGMLELTVLGDISLSNFSSNLDSIPNPSSHFCDLASPASYLEHMSNSTCSQIASSSLFLDHLTDSSSVSSSCFDKFPNVTFIPDTELLPSSIPETEFISHHIPELDLISLNTPSPLSQTLSLAFEEPMPNVLSLLNDNSNSAPTTKKGGAKRKSKKWTVRKKYRPRRSRMQHFCSKCFVGFSNHANLGKHLVEVHKIERPFDCNLCGGKFRTAIHVNRHNQVHDGSAKRYTCEHCSYNTKQKSNLKSHISRVHEKKYKFKCEMCGAGFMQRTKFNEHRRLHLSKRKKLCKFCPKKTFKYSRNLRQHTIDQHPETMDVPVGPKNRIPCPLCPKQYAREQSLQMHLKARHLDPEPNKKFPCEECGAQLSCKSALTQHMRSHTGEKVAVCDICGKGFIKWQNLHVHKRVHTGERPYPCTFCSKAFAQKTTLVHHIRVHTGERPYKCEPCGKGYVSGSLLKKHLRKCPHAINAEGLNAAKGENSNAKAEDSNTKVENSNAKVEESNAKVENSNAKVEESNAKVEYSNVKAVEPNVQVEVSKNEC